MDETALDVSEGSDKENDDGQDSELGDLRTSVNTEEEKEKEEEEEKGGIVTALASNLQQLGKTGQRPGGDRCVRSSCKIVELWRA